MSGLKAEYEPVLGAGLVAATQPGVPVGVGLPLTTVELKVLSVPLSKPSVNTTWVSQGVGVAVPVAVDVAVGVSVGPGHTAWVKASFPPVPTAAVLHEYTVYCGPIVLPLWT